MAGLLALNAVLTISIKVPVEPELELEDSLLDGERPLGPRLLIPVLEEKDIFFCDTVEGLLE